MAGVADEAADWLRGKLGAVTVEPTVTESVTSPPLSLADQQTQTRILLAQQQASRASFDKWLKRIGFTLAGAALSYWFFAVRGKHG